MRAKFADTLNFLSKLTLKRVINVLKIVWGYYMSLYFKKTYSGGIPFSIAIEPTTACNLACPECPSGLKAFSRKTGNIDPVFFKKFIDYAGDKISYLSLYFQGEPFIHPQLFEMIDYASRKRIYTSTSTNGHFLDDQNACMTVKSGLDRLIISIDGTTQETYESYRINGKLEKVIEGTANLVRWKKELKSETPYLIFQFVVFRQNEHQVDEIKELGRKLGVDEVKIKTAQLRDYESGNNRMPENLDLSRYKKNKNGSYAIEPVNAAHCWKMWHSCVISWDGLVLPCCFDKDAKYRLGDLKNDKPEKIWNNDSYRNFRKSLLKGRKEIDICANCSEGVKVWI